MGNNITTASEKLKKAIEQVKNREFGNNKDGHKLLFLLNEAQRLLTTDDQIFISWSVLDIIATGKQKGIVVTKKQAKTILKEMEHRHDATIGINWLVIEYYINRIDEYEK